MKIIAQFDLNDSTNSPGTDLQWTDNTNLKIAQGSRFKTRIYNYSAASLGIRFGDSRNSFDIIPAYTSKYYEIIISSSKFVYTVSSVTIPSNFLTVGLPIVRIQDQMVIVVQYDEDEQVFDTSSYTLSTDKNMYNTCFTFQVLQSTTPNQPIVINYGDNFADTSLFYYIDGYDITCPPVTTPQNLVVHINDGLGTTWINNVYRQDSANPLNIQWRPPKPFITNLAEPLFMKIFALAWGAQTMDVNIYTHMEAGHKFILPVI